MSECLYGYSNSLFNAILLMRFKFTLTIVPLLFLAVTLQAQETVSGRVVDAEGEPLIGLTVLVEQLGTGTYTDFDGNYNLSLDPGDYTLSFSYTGYESQRIDVTVQEGESVDLNLTMEEGSQFLDEVVVVGYGVQRKRDVVGAISQIDGGDLQQISTPSFEAALQGQAAGLAVIQGSGLAGSGSVLQIRGKSTISAGSDPLYVIDGIPITADPFLAENNFTNGAFNNNPLASLNPNDIESIEVLKDASAAGIYGSRATNGVILITTKRGIKGKTSFDFSAGVGTSQPSAKPNFVSGSQWLQLRQEAWENDGNTGSVWVPNWSEAGTPPEIRAQSYQEASQYNTNWWDLVTRTGIKQDYNFGASFGLSEKVRAYAGLSYANEQSYLVDNGFSRYNARLNMDFGLSEKLQLSLNGSYNKGINERVRVSYTGGLGDAMSVALPVYPIYNPDGSYWRGTSGTAANPMFTLANTSGFSIDDRILGTASLTYSPLPKLSFNLHAGYDRFTLKNDWWESAAQRRANEARTEVDESNVDNFNTYLTAEYDFLNSGKHELKGMVGTEYQQSTRSSIYNLVFIGDESVINGTTHENGGDFSEEYRDDATYNETSDDVTKFASLFSRWNYTLNDRYQVQLSGRIDGSSKFHPDNRLGFFPTAAIGWIVSNEPFFHSRSITYLKFKTSAGLLGNANIESNNYIGRLRTGDNKYNDASYIFPTRFANEDLKWESTLSVDLSMDIGLFDDRITATAAYYHKRTKDALLFLTLPNYNGGAGEQYTDNVGEIKNEGVELSLTSYNVNNPNFQWSTTLNGAYNYNEVLDLGQYTPDAVAGGTNDTRVVVGSPVGANYLIRYFGVDQENGRPIYLDINGNQTYEYNEARDRVVVGDVLPDLTGGLQNSFRYKNWNLGFLFVFVTGMDQYDSSSKRQLQFLSDWQIREDIGNHWRKPGDYAIYPKLTLSPAEHGNDKEWFNTDLFLQDASYLRLRNIQLGYDFSPSFVNRLKLTAANISVSATNLFVFTKFPGLDPEVVRDFDNITDRNLSANITYLTPPQERTFNVRLNLTF